MSLYNIMEKTHNVCRKDIRTFGRDVSKAKLSAEALKVLLTLSSAKRLDHLSAISDRLQLILLESANVIALQVETATTLESEEKKKIEDKFHWMMKVC